MTYPYIKFELNVCNPYRDNERKLKISNFFVFKNQRTKTKFELDLRIPMTCLHVQFQPYTLIQTKVKRAETENFIFFFQSSRSRDNSVKINEPLPNSNLSCVFLAISTLYIHPN
jgi:hypothetical protein